MNTVKTLQVRVASRRQQTEDIVGLELREPNGALLLAFTAGAHIDVHAGPGLIRQYSRCSSSSERDRCVIGVLRDPASPAGSIAIRDRYDEGLWKSASHAIVFPCTPRRAASPAYPVLLQLPALRLPRLGLARMTCALRSWPLLSNSSDAVPDTKRLSIEYGVNLQRIYAIRREVLAAAEVLALPPGWDELAIAGPKEVIEQIKRQLADALVRYETDLARQAKP